jgi:hypothetical protein
MLASTLHQSLNQRHQVRTPLCPNVHRNVQLQLTAFLFQAIDLFLFQVCGYAQLYHNFHPFHPVEARAACWKKPRQIQLKIERSVQILSGQVQSKKTKHGKKRISGDVTGDR